MPPPGGQSCILSACAFFVYVAAERALDGVKGGPPLKTLKPREYRKSINAEHAYLALGCACALTLDGADDEDKEERRKLLDQLEVFLAAATADGPVKVLVTDGSRTQPAELAIPVAGFRDFDFDSAWDAPTLLTVLSG